MDTSMPPPGPAGDPPAVTLAHRQAGGHRYVDVHVGPGADAAEVTHALAAVPYGAETCTALVITFREYGPPGQ